MPIKVGLKHIEIWNDSMENAVSAYEREPIIRDQIVFYGPSYFTRWSTKYGMRPLREELRGASGAPCVINRGFGSSCAEHQLYYYPRMIRPLCPRVLVYSSYANGSAFGYTPEESWELAQRVIGYAMTDFPDIRIYLCGQNAKRDPDEENTRRARLYDSLQREFVASHENCFFIDTAACTALASKDNFVPDGVHYNQHGYDLYADFFRRELAAELAQY